MFDEIWNFRDVSALLRRNGVRIAADPLAITRGPPQARTFLLHQYAPMTLILLIVIFLLRFGGGRGYYGYRRGY